MVLQWKLYYHTEKTFSDFDGSWEEAPSKGIVVLVALDPTETWGRMIHTMATAPNSRGDFYVKAPGEEPYCTEDYETFLELPGTTMKMVKYGHMTTQVRYQKLVSMACDDLDFPKYSPNADPEKWKNDPRRNHQFWARWAREVK